MYSYVGHSILDFLCLDAEWLLNVAHQLCFTEPASEIKEPNGKAVRYTLSVHGQHILVFWALAWQHRVEGSMVEQVQVSSERQSKGGRGSVPISSQSPFCEHSTTFQWWCGLGSKPLVDIAARAIANSQEQNPWQQSGEDELFWSSGKRMDQDYLVSGTF